MWKIIQKIKQWFKKKKRSYNKRKKLFYKKTPFNSNMVLSERQKEILLDIFDHENEVLRAVHIKRKLVQSGFRISDRIIRDAINEGYLEINTLVPLWLQLSNHGIEKWVELYG